MNSRPSIIFGMPPVSGLADLIEQELVRLGFDVISLPKLYESARHYPSVSAMLYAKYRKLLRHDKEAAKEMKAGLLVKQLQARLAACGGQADYALFISGDIYGKKLLEYVRNHSRHGSANYQFDGLHRFPAIREKMALFDRFYAFDPDDIAYGQGNVLPATNFYFESSVPSVPDTDCYFIGIHLPERVEPICRFAEYVASAGLQADLNIIARQRLKSKTYPVAVKIHSDFIGFAENRQRAEKSRVLLDFVATDHKGLSFRTFEALGYRKKLITTNPEVQKYDFYHPDNIFVWNKQDFNGLHSFLATPYRVLPEDILHKYSFANWLNYVLNIEPYTKLSLPQ